MNKYIIYTDGSSRGNPGPGGWAAVVIENNYGGQGERFGVALQQAQGDFVTEIGGREDNTTNNRMEMTAAIEALRSVPEGESVEIYTDSEYLLKGITIWIKNWRTNNWRTKNKKDVLNRDLWEALDRENQKRQVEWKKVLGHSGHDINDRCDTIATSFADNKSPKLFHGSRDEYKKFLIKTSSPFSSP